MKFDVEKIDQYMKQENVDTSGIVWYDPAEGMFDISGFYWFGKDRRYQRFPVKLKQKIRKPVMLLSYCTSGGQIRFCTDSRRILLAARALNKRGTAHMADNGTSGFDLYVGTTGKEQYWNESNPVRETGMDLSELFKVPQRELREFRLNFPLYNGVTELQIGLEADAVIQPPTPNRFKRPVVIYGTSITQGGCASRPGMAFTNQLSRRLQAEFLNFGFSGMGQNDPEVAELLSEIIDPAMFIIDSEANSVSGKLVLERVPKFIDILREKHPLTPIVILTKVKYGPRYAEELPSLKKEFRQVFNQRRKAGDCNMFFIDGSSCWRGDYWENTVDGAHPNDLGFTRMADKFAPELSALLKQYEAQ